MNNEIRILGRIVAHELTAQEVAQINGAAWYGTNYRVTRIYPPPPSHQPPEVDDGPSDTLWD